MATGNTIIEVHQVSKLYRLGSISSGTLKKDVSRWWEVNVLKRPDPLQKIDEDETSGKDILWALKDVTFSIKEGEVLGIIGKNGAGKSTLLKILSRVTKPTKGYVKGKGRIASLLEIGTGFHEELTGRENIYLNGNILGLTRRQIDAKLDEIIDFSGVENYIDTPVKRYSSGMYVRLAFSVAAHLDPDILIVDEALSVGDAEFQKKCMNKIHDVSSKQGKTILLVSHSMQAVQGFCNRVILLEKGKLKYDDVPDKVIHKYLQGLQKKKKPQVYHNPDQAPGDNNVRMRQVYLTAETDSTGGKIDVRTTLHINFECWSLVDDLTLSVGMYLFTVAGECIFTVLSDSVKTSKGLIEGRCTIPGNFLTDGSYTVSLTFFKNITEDIFYYEECLYFDVNDDPDHMAWYGNWSGFVRPKLPFTLTLKNKAFV